MSDATIGAGSMQAMVDPYKEAARRKAERSDALLWVEFSEAILQLVKRFGIPRVQFMAESWLAIIGEPPRTAELGGEDA